ncbi:DUF2063 domain-containing protein [Vibrio sp. SM6]|uniref:DUF2063 domain-containing protein n=1 Tax=Vibrio agarilyticus TaxID=2726741 RepID=A0A7X8YGV1_9VIBR|nr:DNA-binding domain-containing protein [Vibrio agarilyticus]NLS13418.1 DUF2063 domain-containing protein [Vibrio agarilyticus]
MTLNELQIEFQNIVLAPCCRGADWVTQNTPSSSENPLSATERLNIYHNAYRARLLEVMEDTFAHTALYLGEVWFEQLAKRYIELHHSTFNNIGLYGDLFASFLHQQLPQDGDVAELATMDWQLRRAFDGKESFAMTLEQLGAIAAQHGDAPLTLCFVATLSRVPMAFNTLEIWHAIDQEQTPPVAFALHNPIDVVIWRKGDSPHFRSLSPMESQAIQCVENGLDLNEIGDHLQTKFPQENISAELGLLIQRWISDEMLAFAPVTQ